MAGKAGSAAIPFELPDTNGALISLDQYAGKWLLMVFHRHLG